MIKIQEGRDYQVIDLGHCMEIRSNLFDGILGAVEEYTKKGYSFNYDAIRAMGNMYVIPTIGKECTPLCPDVSEELLEENKKLKTENRTQKTQITKLKKKIK